MMLPAQVIAALLACASPAKVVLAQATPVGPMKPFESPKTVSGPVDAGTQPAARSPQPAAQAPVPAMAPETKALVDRMQGFYEKTHDFQARFRQDYTYKSFKRTQTSTGTVTFKKPGLMRWEYEKPSAKTFVLAGDRVYAHDPEARTLTKASIGTNQLSASVTFLWGKGRLADEFSIAQKPCPRCAGTLLELTPLKPDPRFQRILLEVDPKTAQVVKSTVVDPDGSTNAITFSELKTNVGVNEQHFKLSPPAGTQIIDYTQKGASPDAGAK